MRGAVPACGRQECTVCDSKLFGRSDKVFCTIKCKNKAYAKQRKEFEEEYHEVIRELRRNNYILNYLKGKNTEKFIINKKELRRLGFNFDIITGWEQNKYGIKLHLFNFSWYQINSQNIMVYCNPDEKPLSPYIYKRWLRHLKPKLGENQLNANLS